MAENGRPQLAIDWDTVGKLLEAGCSGESIAAQLGVQPYIAAQRAATMTADYRLPCEGGLE